MGPYSALVIRGEDDQIRAFVNACPHRGMALTDAGSCGQGKQFIRCPFHGMVWHLDGSLREIPCRWDFPHIEDAEFGLDEIPCETWAGFVFINFDKACEPLKADLGVLPEHFKDWGLEDRFVAVHTVKTLPGNWKMCMEGFLEAFHVLGTHPEVIHTASWANTQYDVFGPTVTRFLQTVATGNPNETQSQAEIYRLLGYTDELPDGTTAREQHAQHQRAALGQRFKTDLSAVSTSIMLDSIEYHLFPNASVSVLSKHSNLTIMEPLTPNSTKMVTYLMTNASVEGESVTLEDAERDAQFVTESGQDEDRAAACSIQETVTAQANSHLTFGYFEKAIVNFHRHLSNSLDR